ncbi:MAG: hypothetical protein EBY32_17050 [Proteobacteria bacterium]|jgi:hypothetical protein|nr:hypothetical protein [Pseudomonadota bacterium]
MSLNKEAVSKAEYLKSLRPAAALDPAFPYFDEWVVKSNGAGDAGWIGKSPSGFDPAYFEAEISLPEP